jgi:hypothetical protein
MASPLLRREEAGQEQALGRRRLHNLRIRVTTAIHHEQVEDRPQCRRGRRKIVRRRRRGGEVRQDAGVVEEFGLGRRAAIAQVAKMLEEEAERVPVRHCQPWMGLHDALPSQGLGAGSRLLQGETTGDPGWLPEGPYRSITQI